MSVAKQIVPFTIDDGRIRVVIESITPSVDDGKFAVKRIVGDRLEVEADVFADGHDVVACQLLWRRAGQTEWQQQTMRALGNDRWSADFVVDEIGRWEYTVRGWVDPFLSWQHDFARRLDPEDVRIAALTGAQLIDAAASRAGKGADAKELNSWSRELAKAGKDKQLGVDEIKRIGMDEAHSAVARRHPDLSLAWTHERIFPLLVERERARFSSWYEFFPRSASDDPARHGTFKDCEGWLPYIKRMGFDVVYFPPIHPVGRSRRKGKNNTLDPGPDDVGSPWAIGAAEGGHDAILNELGTLKDFKQLLKKANDCGIEIALDIAFQCAPDHPWVKEHPDWFRKRADGSIQYAENPPKKYQDIYPFDFETSDWRGLWAALAGVFEYWAAQGVRIFRVDNPHTKAYPFWEWAIAHVRKTYPDAIFLSEAFTRPRVMHRLAKVGFSQSYTYYTWRNTKWELTQYFTELSQGPGRDYFRPNVWPNTPDILPAALQQGQRSVFMARHVMAATLAANYGMYGPAYELLEHKPLREGGEEYLDSEKFERKVWDRSRADSLAEFIGVINAARHAHPALQNDHSLRFMPVDNDALIAYAKHDPERSDIIVCVVNIDPHHVHSGWVELDLEALGIEADKPYQMHDLITDARFLWTGPRNFVQLDPNVCPAHVMHLRAKVTRENDFDYFQ
ncbi:alpha-1,4-glucan--maltose-1-phosphate maltosyltransferase [Piscinibacter sakaiensis]|uniref:alpha-1,4-glucan--maltose-1-phosphate maltosyltransferase n=1 Tax=Piscinibacter sakaiensis TaxID=1547922 RepID=UPI003AAD8CB9